jgi:superfamily II RNA helicase
MEYRGLSLDPFQQDAIQALADGCSVLVSAPTGTGKTLIADWMVDRALQQNKRAIYTAPIKALSNQKYRDYCRLHGTENVGLVTGDLVIRRDAPCLVMTTEILRNMLLGDEAMDDLAAVVLDEIHFLDDRERGTVWEEVLIYLPEHVRVVGLSATLSNLDDFAAWIEHVRGHPVQVVVEHERAVPLSFQYFCRDTGLRTPEEFQAVWHKRKGAFEAKARASHRGGRPGRRPQRRTTHLDVFRAIERAEMLPYLYFVFSRKDTEQCARSLARSLGKGLLSWEEQEQVDTAIATAQAQMSGPIDPDIVSLYRQGIAFHHAGLHVCLKVLVEQLYEQRLVRVLYTTSTFALGINIPARTVVFDGLEKYDGRRMSPLTCRQFMQKAGRAGRRGMDEEGHVVIRLDMEQFRELRPRLERYMQGRYEPVRSSFNLSWNSVIQLIQRHEPERIRGIVEKSFLAWFHAGQARRKIEEADLGQAQSSKKGRKRAAHLRKQAEASSGRCWAEFERKVSFLMDSGYLAEDASFQAGALVLRHLQINEILVTELVLDCSFESLSTEDLFGLLCALVTELPRNARRCWQVRRQDKRLAAHIQQVRLSDLVVDAESLCKSPSSWDADMIEIGRRWAEGWPLLEVLGLLECPTDMSGNLVNAFRRAKDLAGQLRQVYRDDPSMSEALRTVVERVSRDEVEVVG